MVEEFWWNSDSGTGMVELRWWNTYKWNSDGRTGMVDSETVVVEQLKWISNGGTLKVEQ